MPNFLKEAEKLFDYTQALRRDFHLHPELGLQEYRTAGIIANELKSLDLEVSTGIAETGVVAIIEGGKPLYGEISISDGRHRFFVLKGMGKKTIIVTVSNTSDLSYIDLIDGKEIGQ